MRANFPIIQSQEEDGVIDVISWQENPKMITPISDFMELFASAADSIQSIKEISNNNDLGFSDLIDSLSN